MAESVERRFSDKEAAANFRKLAQLFYDKNYGQASKSEVELLMFHFYMKNLRDKASASGSKSYSTYSDYKISKEIGITQQRVRNLKIKEQLIYPREFNWKEEFEKLLDHAQYNKVTHMVSIDIPDPNLYIEIKNYFQENGKVVEKTLNSREFKIRIDNLLIFVIEISDNRDEFVKQLKDNMGDLSKASKSLDSTSFLKEFFEKGKDINSSINTILDIAGKMGMAITAVNAIVNLVG